VKVFSSSEIQSHHEAYASLGHDAYYTMPRLRDAWVIWNLARKREAEQVRARRRDARERRWLDIAEGTIPALGSSDADHFAGQAEPGSEATLEDAIGEMREQRREQKVAATC
jgi:hypothetical protein